MQKLFPLSVLSLSLMACSPLQNVPYSAIPKEDKGMTPQYCSEVKLEDGLYAAKADGIDLRVHVDNESLWETRDGYELGLSCTIYNPSEFSKSVEDEGCDGRVDFVKAHSVFQPQASFSFPREYLKDYGLMQDFDKLAETTRRYICQKNIIKFDGEKEARKILEHFSTQP